LCCGDLTISDWGSFVHPKGVYRTSEKCCCSNASNSCFKLYELFRFTNKNNKEQIFTFFDKHKYNGVKKSITNISNFIDVCVAAESNKNKGSVKSIFPVIVNHIRKLKLIYSENDAIFTSYLDISNFNILKKICDVSLMDSRLSNRFIKFTEELQSLGVSSSKIVEIIREYFKENKVTIIHSFNSYISMNKHQEYYQILLYLVMYDIDDFFEENKILDLLSNDLDDFSLILLSVIFIRNNYDINKYLEKTDEKLINNHEKYEENYIHSRESLWLFRYFFYSVVKSNIIKKQEINSYCKGKNYNTNKYGYISELNYKNTFNSDKNIDRFYKFLLDNDVKLVNFGENNSLRYISVNTK
jgi:hypothetical protein